MSFEEVGICFVPMETVRCDIVILDDLMKHKAVRTMLDVLQTRSLHSVRSALSVVPPFLSASMVTSSWAVTVFDKCKFFTAFLDKMVGR